MDALVISYLFKPDSWEALVEVTREAFGLDLATELVSKARPQAGYIALALDEARRRKLVGLLRKRLGQDAGSAAEALFRALMLLGGPIGPPPFVWPQVAPIHRQITHAG